MKLAFEDLYTQRAEVAEVYLAHWMEMTLGSGLEPMIDFACSVDEHCDGVVLWFHSKSSRWCWKRSPRRRAAKRRARDYRTKRNLKASVDLAAGKLNFNRAT